MSIDGFIDELENLSFENTFNPYSEQCEIHDCLSAPRMRRELLRSMLIAAKNVEVDAIWIGRDLGHRGGRRTGLALTDDVHLPHHVSRWGVDCEKITKGSAVSERTAAVIWSVLNRISLPIFLWNVFPLHPFEAGTPFSNRAHNSKERKAGEEILTILMEFLNPIRLIAIGNDAERVASRFGEMCKVVKVRHPSYGGQNTFLKQMHSLYDINTTTPTNLSLFD